MKVNILKMNEIILDMVNVQRVMIFLIIIIIFVGIEVIVVFLAKSLTLGKLKIVD